MPHYLKQILRLPRSHWGRACTALTICVAIWSGASKKIPFGGLSPAAHLANENSVDAALQSAAVNALGQREGTIVIMDPQTGRVRAVVNPEMAFANAFSPGSTIKPFVTLAALRSGLIESGSRTLCREHYSHKDFATVCSHPRDLPPLNPAQAIAYSCNYYFGTLGERLTEERLSETLLSFGFGRPTGGGGDHEARGALLRGKHDPRNTLGEGGYLQTTPLQLLTAYAALLNGGQLLTPGAAQAKAFQIARRSTIEMTAEQRSLLIEGMRGAVIFGTAKNAGLDLSDLYIFGKTGTSTPLNGFRSQGWFVGFAADSQTAGVPAPDKVELAVVVFLKRAHGADAAALARGVFEEYAKAKAGVGDGETRGDAKSDTETRRRGDAATISEGSALPSAAVSSPLRIPVSVIVHLNRENITKQISLEDYVAGVVATEGSLEDRPEALKALAVAVRTYTLKNLGRHARDGYDFCTLTHCQRFDSAVNVSGPGAQAMTNRRARAAVRATTGVVLRDELGHPADAYFSASCGGATADMKTLWGAESPPYLRGVTDEYCAGMPHHSWTDVIPATQLLQALRSDPRTDPGARLDDVRVAQRDASGRAESIAIEGFEHRAVSGWDFKIIVGRALGWSKLKSSRFEITRAGSEFIFHGSGFGHGLGLCQEGAHVLAQRGASYQQILAKYFPGAALAGVTQAVSLRSSESDIDRAAPINSLRYHSAAQTNGTTANNSSRVFGDLLWEEHFPFNPSPSLLVAPSTHHPVASAPRLSISSEHFRVSYPARTAQRDAEEILKTLESARVNLLRHVAAAGLSISEPPALEIFINETTGDFVGRTGLPSWAAAATKGTRIELQPIPILQRRGVLLTTLRHELTHVVVDAISHGRAPRWLAEGMALYFAGEGAMIARYTPRTPTTLDQVDQKLAGAATAAEMRAAYAAAYREVSVMIKRDGEAKIWRRAASR